MSKTLENLQEIVRNLEVDNSNLRHRLSMAESSNPDSVLSKHNAMLMAVRNAEHYRERLKEATALDKPNMQHPDSELLDRIAEKLEQAVSAANGRWSEWGYRALDVAEYLDEAQDLLRTRAAGQSAYPDSRDRCLRDGALMHDGKCVQCGQSGGGQ